jgi:hypothetical protein
MEGKQKPNEAEAKEEEQLEDVGKDLRDDREDARELESDISELKAKLDKFYAGGSDKGAGADKGGSGIDIIPEVIDLKQEIKEKSNALHTINQAIDKEVKVMTEMYIHEDKFKTVPRKSMKTKSHTPAKNKPEPVDESKILRAQIKGLEDELKQAKAKQCDTKNCNKKNGKRIKKLISQIKKMKLDPAEESKRLLSEIKNLENDLIQAQEKFEQDKSKSSRKRMNKIKKQINKKQSELKQLDQTTNTYRFTQKIFDPIEDMRITQNLQNLKELRKELSKDYVNKNLNNKYVYKNE